MKLDIAIAALLIGFAALFGFLFVDFSIPPFEDAAMLMRYAEHLAEGQGIVWNIGEPPVDGATDFLFMAIVAALHALGLSLEASVRGLDIACHLATAALIYFGMRGVQGAGRGAAAASALYFALGPGLYLAAAYFGTPCFALAIASTWLIAQSIMFAERPGRARCFAFAVGGLIAGLIRPEGVLYAGLFWISILIARRKRRVEGSAIFWAVMLGLGGCYFVWRWRYFGHPLPNPFYKKGGGHFYPGSLLDAARENFLIVAPFAAVLAAPWFDRNSRRLALAIAIPFVGSTLMWGLLSNEMNFGARFQYPTVALICLSWFPLGRALVPGLRALPGAGSVAFCIYALFAIGYGAARASAITYHQDGRVNVGKLLASRAGGDPVLATTEAGLLPLYSGWRTVDAWGLNDSWIAHHGGVTEAYLDERRPDVIVIHAGIDGADAHYGEAWDRMTDTLKAYANSHGFELAAAFCQTPRSAHFYYVRRDMPDAAAIIEGIRSLDYRWQSNGLKTRNCVVGS